MRHRPHHRAPLWALLLAPLAAAASSADGGPAAQSPSFAVGLPDKSWRLLLDVPGFDMEPVHRLSSGARVLGSADRLGLTVSLTLARSPGDPSARSCRDHDWAGRQKALLGREETRLSAEGEQARVEFLVPGDGGKEKHVLLYLQRDGVCAIVHLSKLRYQPADADSMERLLASVRLGD